MAAPELTGAHNLDHNFRIPNKDQKLGNGSEHKHKHLGLKIASGALAGSIAITGGVMGIKSWLGMNGGENNNIITTSQSSSAKESNSPQPSASSSKVSSSSENLTSSQQEDLIAKEALAKMPVLAGAKKVWQDNGIGKEGTYVSENGNPYGVEANKFLGVYRENVTLENEKVGGVALIPSVVNKLLSDGLAKIPDGQDKWMLFIPADISEIKDSDAKITMEIVDTTNASHVSNAALKISFNNQKVSIPNPIVDGQNSGINNSGRVDAFTYPNFLNDIQKYGLWNKDVVDQTGLDVLGNFNYPKLIVGDKVAFGTKITETDNPIYEGVVSQTASGRVETNRILTVDKSPVFVIDQ